MRELDLSLYYVTDSSVFKTQEKFLAAVEQILEGGVTILQLREKKLETPSFIELAKKIKKICHSFGVPLIINDNVDVALQVEADGIHLGQEDTSFENAFKKLGAQKIYGISVSSVEEAKKASKLPIDYLGVGSLFPTSSKTDANLLSLEELKNIRKITKKPIVVIGGISKKTIGILENLNINGVAVIRALQESRDFKKTTQQLKKLVDKIVSNPTH